MTEPLVGVIVPCFNQAAYAAECVASIEAQTHPNLQVVVIDDASTDGQGALLDELASGRVRVVHLERNAGRALVRNEAARRLDPNIEYLLNVDCDDRLSPDYVARLVAALERDRKAGLAYGTLHFFGEVREGPQSWPRDEYVHAERYLENRIPGPGVLFRMEAFRQTEGWRAPFTRGHEDVDIWLQVVEHGWTPVWVRDAVYHYRQHAASYLATATNLVVVAADLEILRHHRRGIAESIGIDAYLERHVLPAVRATLRAGGWREVAPIVRTLFAIAPLTASRLFAAYYAGRLRSRAGRERGQ